MTKVNSHGRYEEARVAGSRPGTQMVIGQQANAEGKNPPETGGFVEKVFG